MERKQGNEAAASAFPLKNGESQFSCAGREVGGGACGAKEGVVLHRCTVSCHIHQPISPEDGEKFIHQRLWVFRVDLIQQTVVGDQSSVRLRPEHRPQGPALHPPMLCFFSLLR